MKSVERQPERNVDTTPGEFIGSVRYHRGDEKSFFAEVLTCYPRMGCFWQTIQFEGVRLMNPDAGTSS